MTNQKSFTMIEVLVALVVTSLIAVAAVTNLSSSNTKAYKTTACNNLRAINVSQQGYWENNRNAYYSTDPARTSCYKTSPAIDDTLCINEKLKTTITPSGSMRYICDAGNDCKAYGPWGANTVQYADCLIS
jgi:prepilin-type N-terminal cleavage/methylation domain-containing protein